MMNVSANIDIRRKKRAEDYITLRTNQLDVAEFDVDT
jgi:hypothetical protein